MSDVPHAPSAHPVVYVWHRSADAAIVIAARLMRVRPRVHAIPVTHSVPRTAHVVVAALSDVHDAADVVHLLRAQAPHTVLISAIAHPDVKTATAAVLAGAEGVIDLDAPDRTLARSLDVILTDGAYVPASFQAPVLAALATYRRNSARNCERLASLTPNERRVLGMLDAGNDRDAIARRLQVPGHRVRATIDRAKAKLGVSTQRQALEFFRDELSRPG